MISIKTESLPWQLVILLSSGIAKKEVIEHEGDKTTGAI